MPSPRLVPPVSADTECELQCVAVCCSVLQCVAVCCSVLQEADKECKQRKDLKHVETSPYISRQLLHLKTTPYGVHVKTTPFV